MAVHTTRAARQKAEKGKSLTRDAARQPARVISIIKGLFFFGAFGEAVKAELGKPFDTLFILSFPPPPLSLSAEPPFAYGHANGQPAISDTASPFLKCHTHTHRR